MKEKIFILLLISFSFGLSALPILTDVFIVQNDSLEISWKILRPEEGMKIDLGCFRKTDKKIFSVKEENISGDFGKLPLKDTFSLKIDLSALPPDFNPNDYIIFPKLIFQDRIYYEMERFRGGSYAESEKNNVIEVVSAREFYICKFEVTNEQFLAFVNADGYEFQEYWKVDSNLMSRSEIGWFYQAKYRMSLPMDWTFADHPYFKNAKSNFIYGPVTNVRWFEANAFCNWMQGQMPDLKQIKIAFLNSDVSNDDMFSGISVFQKGKFPLQKIRDGVSEWLMSGVDPTSMACAGCNEMDILKNNSLEREDKINLVVKCPLYRAADLGFRFVAIPPKK